MITLTIPKTHWQAHCISAPTNDTRAYLNGINVETNGTKTVTLVTTNGHYLIATRYDQDCEIPQADFIVPIAFAKSVKFTARQYDLLLEFESVPGETKESPPKQTITLRNMYAGTVTSAAPVDGTYPDWRRVLRLARSPSGEAGQYNARYLGKMGDINEKLTGGCTYSPIIHHNGTKAGALVQFQTDNAIGALMQLNTREGFPPPPYVGDWLGEGPEPAIEPATETSKVAA
jgi:hypothetical protein